ncbi:hypothetical protein [uncultured Vagococcus sp.]|uniref:hypothetical protein n=1 Tax=uncultured Vagococcus sp. TaxID=189676 RepID=UPI0028D2879B|nr:hypothetical protein [uncultured Vagococcus sp.]
MIGGYTGVSGLIFFLYSFQALNTLLNDPDSYSPYVAPRIMTWLYDKIGPLLTTVISLLIGSLMITVGLYQLLAYGIQKNKLTSTSTKGHPHLLRMIDEE